MKILQVVNYQSSLFLPNPSAQFNADDISYFMPLLSEFDLLPNYQQFIRFDPNSLLNSKAEPQLQLVSKDRSWNIEFESNRLKINLNNYLAEKKYSPQEFCEASAKMYEGIVKISPVKGSRLSYIQATFFSDPNLTPFFKEFLPSFYRDRESVAWSVNNACRLSNHSSEIQESSFNEELNISMKAGKATLQEKNDQLVDGMQLVVDINTLEKNLKQRFDVEDVDVFFQVALKYAETIINQMESIK